MRTPSEVTSVLFVTATPDDRASTVKLERLVREMDRRRDATAVLWYLRKTDTQRPAPRTRVVDSLRTWAPVAVLHALGLTRAAGLLGGARLRLWLRGIRPAVVVLDDGLGLRIVEHMHPAPRLVIRLNDEQPADLPMEPSPTPPSAADLVIAASEHLRTDGERTRWRIEGLLTPEQSKAARRFSRIEAMQRQRVSLGLPKDDPLIVGWGDDGWLDGPDLFVRTLWALEHHQGVRAHGLWLGLSADADEAARIRSEAERCGLADRFHHLPHDRVGDGTTRASRDNRYCGDAVFLPYRSPTDAIELMTAACSGSVVVAFEAASVEDPLVHTIANLDVEQAAAALASGLTGDRMARAEMARERFETLFDQIIAAGTSESVR